MSNTCASSCACFFASRCLRRSSAFRLFLSRRSLDLGTTKSLSTSSSLGLTQILLKIIIQKTNLKCSNTCLLVGRDLVGDLVLLRVLLLLLLLLVMVVGLLQVLLLLLLLLLLLAPDVGLLRKQPTKN